MGYIIPFQRRLRQQVTRFRWRWHHRRLNPLPLLMLLFVSIATYIALSQGAVLPDFKPVQSQDVSAAWFGKCWSVRYNCVIDGDTFYYEGERVRIADIDTPETHPPRCAYEATLGEQATDRLVDLLNEGPFTLRPISGRDQDKYGRKLRTVVRDGRSLGGVLVSEGLARWWTGYRQPWCA